MLYHNFVVTHVLSFLTCNDILQYYVVTTLQEIAGLYQQRAAACDVIFPWVALLPGGKTTAICMATAEQTLR